MPPFDNWLTRKIRIAIMLFLVAVFIIASPLLVLYTAGYRYNWKEKTIKQTGVVSIDATPREATVTLNDTAIHKRLPLRLPNIAPGDYHLRIAHGAYHPWEKDITVLSKETTYIKDISLFKDTLPVLTRPKTNGDMRLIGSAETRALLLREEKEEQQELSRYTADTRETQLIRRDSTKGTVITTSDTSPTMVIITQTDKGTMTYLASLNAPDNMTPFSWSIDHGLDAQLALGSFPPAAYIKTKGTIYRIQSDRTKTKLGIATTTLWFVDPDERIWGIEKNTLVRFSPQRKIFATFTDRTITSIIDIQKKRVLLATDKGIAVAAFDADKDEVKTIHYLSTYSIRKHPGNNEWWSWSEWELWNIAESGDVVLLNRSGERIRLVRPLDEFGVVAIATENTISAFNAGYFVTNYLAHADEIRDVEVDIEKRKIFFVGKIGNQEGLFELDY